MHHMHKLLRMTTARELVKVLRERQGLKQGQLARKCDAIDRVGVWPQSKISRIETGKMELTVEDLEVIVRALGTTMPQFFRARRAA